jgi:glycosidase
MVAESERSDAQVDVYDVNYSFKWEYHTIDVFSAKKPASALRDIWEIQNKKFVKGARVLRALDNHDTASDACQPNKGGARFEVQFGNRGMDAIQVMNFTIDGIPFIYNGNEFADDAPFSMFGDNKHGRMFVAWENIATKEGWARMNLIRKLTKLRKDNTALWNGETKWIDNSAPNSILSFTRIAENEKVLVVINTRNAPVNACVKLPNVDVSTTMLNYGCDYKDNEKCISVKMKPYGYIVLRYDD